MRFRILYQDDSIVAVDKPAGLHVHPPEFLPEGVREPKTVMKLLRAQLGRRVYPTHRLDRATSGALLFALDAAAAGRLARQFRDHSVEKRYACVVRGWFGAGERALDARHGLGRTLRVERALGRERSQATSGEPQAATTELTPIYRWEWPAAVGKYATARYTLIEARPESGRYHQIRRHLAGLGYPVVGDGARGDGAHNRYFRETLGLPGLMLKALTLEFDHPANGARMRVRSRWNSIWHRLFDLCGACAVGAMPRRGDAFPETGVSGPK